MTDKIREKFEACTQTYYEGDFAKYENGDYVSEQQQDDFTMFTSGYYQGVNSMVEGCAKSTAEAYQTANAEARELNDRVRFVLIEVAAVLEVLPVDQIFRTQIENLREKVTKATKWLEEGK